MRPSILFVFLALVIGAFCEIHLEHCGEQETDVVGKYNFFKGCVPINVRCFMTNDVFMFKGKFLDCFTKQASFDEDNKFKCTNKNITWAVQLDCMVAFEHSTSYSVMIWILAVCLLIGVIIYLVKNGLLSRNQDLQDCVCYCISIIDSLYHNIRR